jgi:hypothetical protein
MMAQLPPPDHPAWQQWARTSPVLAGMLQRGDPLTRGTWLRRSYVFDEVPDPVPPEVEQQMPPPFRQLNEDQG